tara:strand:+ start:257 stop:589 length:333 start_codon:yes stop_codon:yes gene_type:complete
MKSQFHTISEIQCKPDEHGSHWRFNDIEFDAVVTIESANVEFPIVVDWHDAEIISLAFTATLTDAEGNEVQELIHRVEDSEGSSERYVEFIEVVSMITDDLEQHAIEHMN